MLIALMRALRVSQSSSTRVLNWSVSIGLSFSSWASVPSQNFFLNSSISFDVSALLAPKMKPMIATATATGQVVIRRAPPVSMVAQPIPAAPRALRCRYREVSRAP